MWHLIVPVRSHKVAQPEAMHSSRQSDPEKDIVGKNRRDAESKTNVRAVLSGRSGFNERPSSDFEINERRNGAGDMFPNDVRYREPRSSAKWFRAPSGFEARPSIDLERPIVAEHARAVISTAMCEKAMPVRCAARLCTASECCRKGNKFKANDTSARPQTEFF